MRFHILFAKFQLHSLYLFLCYFHKFINLDQVPQKIRFRQQAKKRKKGKNYKQNLKNFDRSEKRSIHILALKKLHNRNLFVLLKNIKINSLTN